MANKPNNPALWSRAKSLARQKFDVYPSAYANGWAAKWYKGKGGTWRKAKDGMQVPDNPGFNALPPAVHQKIMDNMAYGGYIPEMGDGGRMPPEIARARFAAAGNLDKMDDYGYAYGGYIPEMAYGGSAQQAAIAIAMKKAGKKPKGMKDGGEPNGEMALGQMAAVQDKMSKLLQFVRPDDNLDPWIASKLAVMDHSADAIADYMMYGPEAEEMDEMQSGGGIPAPVKTPYSREYMRALSNEYDQFYAPPRYYGKDDGYDAFYSNKSKSFPKVKQDSGPGWITTYSDGAQGFSSGDREDAPKQKPGRKYQYVDNYITEVEEDLDVPNRIIELMRSKQTNMYRPEYQREYYKSGGGIPERYKNMGFTKVGVKKESTRPGKKWMVLAKKGDDYKVVHGGYDGMKDYSQHGSEQRKENFWNRMGGKNSAKATDPFSPLYWHKRFGTWAEGGEIPMAKDGKNFSVVDFLQSQGAQSDYATRKKLAETIYGINNYTGSAEQNLQLLRYLSGEQAAPGQPIYKDPPSAKTAPAAPAPVRRAPVADKPLPGKKSSMMMRGNFTNEQMPANFKNEQNLQSGMVVDKRANQAYIIENGKVRRSFPVLTGQNPEGTANPYSVAELNNFPAGRVTPAGTYQMQPRADIYGAPGFHMNPIAAFGDPAVASKAAAVHTTYDPAVRNKYYGMAPDQRYRSFGCVNCKRPDVMDVVRTFPQGDTLIVLDPVKNAKDRRYLQKLKSGRQDGGLIEYAEGDEVLNGLPKYDMEKGRLNILNPFRNSMVDPFKNSFYNPFTKEYGTPKAPAPQKLKPLSGKEYDYMTPAMVNMGLSAVAGIAQGISDNRNINYNTSDSLMPVVRNNYSRGRNEINTGRYADDSLVPVQFAGTPVAEYYGAPQYQFEVGGTFDVASGILGLPKMRDDINLYREPQIEFDYVPGENSGPAPSAESAAPMRSSGANPLAESTWEDISSEFQGVKHLGIWGDKRHQKTKSDHNTGDALDIGITDPEQGNKIAQKLIKEAGNRNVKYIIWNNQIWNPSVSKEWRPYSGSNPHTSHVHVSFNSNGRNPQDLGEISMTHNNPLNIHYGDYASKYGGIKGSKDAGGFVSKFPDMNTGIQAAKDLLFGSNYNDLTISQARNKWVSGNPATPNASTKDIVKNMGGDLRLRDLNAQQREKLIKLFAKWEGKQGYNQIKDMKLYGKGGGIPYQENDVYELDQNEINAILSAGGTVEFI